MTVRNDGGFIVKIAICDDEKQLRAEVAEIVNNFFEATNMTCQIEEFDCGSEFVKKSSDYDLVFLDYQLKDGNGIEFAKEMRTTNQKTFLVFLTSFDNHVFESFRLDTFRYLVKPVKVELVKEALEDFIKIYQTNRKIIVVEKEKTTYHDVDEVMYIQADGKHSVVRTTADSLDSIKKISEYEAEINNPQFFRTHRSYIVNMKYISEIDKKRITLTNGEIIVISPKNHEQFLRNYMSYLKYKS